VVASGAERYFAIMAVLLAASCGGEPASGLRVVHRFTAVGSPDATRTIPATMERRARARFPARSGSTAFLPTATIADDTRVVLATHPAAIFGWRTTVRPSRNGHVGTTRRLPAELADAGQVVLSVRARAWKPKRGEWRAQPPAIVDVERTPKGALVRVDAKVQPTATVADIQVLANRPPLTEHTEHRTEVVSVPEDGVLDVALGVLDAARLVGPVTFEVSLCDGDACDTAFSETVTPSEPAATGWLPRRIPLGAWEGTRRAFVFRTTDPTGHSLPVWGTPTLLAPGTSPAPTNVLLISIDTLRRDHLDLYGYERETAPFLTTLAARGTVFDGLVAEAATTGPSHMTMFTSLPALVHGLTGGLRSIDVPVTTMAETFLAAGRRTAAFTEDGPLAQHSGFGLGFEVYTENKSATLLHPSGQVDRTFGQVREWLAAHGEEPFFVFAHTFQVHAPYAPPDRYGVFFTEEPSPERAARPARGRKAAVQYDREIRYVDDELRSLVAWMEERQLLGNTLLVIVSDHGEEFYEHGSLGHGTLPWQQVLGVPLVMVGPGVPAGRREPGIVHHVDLMPTILTLAGVGIPAGLHGYDVAFWRPGPHRPAGEPLFSASWMLPRGLEAPAFSVRDGNLKLISHGDARGRHDAVYDLDADADERTPRSDDAEARRLGEALDAWRVRMAAEAEQRRSGAEGEHDATTTADPDREDKLRELGYIDD